MADAVLRVPGRIEVLGKHVDYAGGRSLLCATDHAFSLAVTRTDTGTLRLRDATRRLALTVDATRPEEGGASPGPAWMVYPRVVVQRVVADFGRDAVPGCDVEFRSDIPSSAGLSSSSAFVTGLFLALDAAAGLLDSDIGRRAVPDAASLAEYLGAVESGHPYPGFSASAGEGVGVRGGAQDHTAILCSRPGALLQAAFGPVKLEREIALPADLRFVIGVSGVRAPKTGAVRDRYNALSDRGRRIAEVWRREREESVERSPHLGAVVGRLRSGGASADQVLADVTGVLRRSGEPDTDALVSRATQFVTETEVLVPGAVRALQAGDAEGLAGWVDRSQELADTVLDNQVPATRALVRAARAGGAVAASSFGAGFGGAVWALVTASDAPAFVRAWRSRYRREFPDYARRARFLETAAADPAGPLPARFRS